MSRLFSKAEEEFIWQNYKGKSTNELTTLVNNTFNRDYKPVQLRYYKKWHKLLNGVDMKFKKGVKPYNFKNNGETFIDARGYPKIKVNGKWEMMQRYVYEQAKGEIPKNYSVVFLDGDRLNLSLDNLMAIPTREKLICKNNNLFSKNKEVTKTGIMVAQLMSKTKEIREGKNNER